MVARIPRAPSSEVNNKDIGDATNNLYQQLKCVQTFIVVLTNSWTVALFNVPRP